MSRPTEDQAMFAIPDQLRSHTLQGYWAVVPYAKHDLITFKNSPGMDRFVPEVHRFYAVDLCNKLNREIHFDGKWIVCWCEFDLGLGMPRHLAMLFADRDGDVQFVVDSDEELAAQIYGMDDYIQQCAEAHKVWRDMLKDVGVEQRQKIMAGVGQASVDPRATPDVMPFQ